MSGSAPARKTRPESNGHFANWIHTPTLTADLFLVPNNLVRMGVPPIRIKLLTSVSGVEFSLRYAERETVRIEDMEIPVISLSRLRQNKAASGRTKDLADLENLPA